MSRTVDTFVANILAYPTTNPGFLVEIEFSPVVRFSTRGDITFQGNVFQAYALEVSRLNADAATIVFGDADAYMTGLTLNQKPAGRVARIWVVYGDAPLDTEPVLVFDGFASKIDSIEEDRLTLSFSSTGAARTKLPAITMSQFLGGEAIRPGTQIVWGGEVYNLEPR